MLSQCSRVTKPLTFKGMQDDVVARNTFLFKNTPFHQRLHDDPIGFAMSAMSAGVYSCDSEISLIL